MTLIDLSHDFADGMPGFSLRRDGEVKRFTAAVRPFLTHEESAPFYQGKASFEITEVKFQTSIGTYLDAPRHRWPAGRDIAALRLDELVLPAIRVDVVDALPNERVGLGRLALPEDIAGLAVLVRFGWDRYWGKPNMRIIRFWIVMLSRRCWNAAPSCWGLIRSTWIPGRIRNGQCIRCCLGAMF